MTKARAVPIGECPCPVEGCGEKQIPVFKFRPKNADPKFTRFGGKWYCRCPEHGTFGFDGAKGIQEHIANKGKIWGDQPGAPAAADANKETNKPAAGASPSTSSTSAASRTPSSAPSSRSSSATPAAAAARQPMRLFGWSERK